MTDDRVLYTTRWNVITRRPHAGHDWVDPTNAERLYESPEGIIAVDARFRDADGLPAPRWVIGVGTSRRFRVQFFDSNTTIWRLVDYDWIGQRLWRWITVDYTYDGPISKKLMSDAVRTREAAVEVDGSGDLTIVEKGDDGPGSRQVTEFSGRASNAYWLDRPKFGDWSALAQPGPSAEEVAGIDAPVPG